MKELFDGIYKLVQDRSLAFIQNDPISLVHWHRTLAAKFPNTCNVKNETLVAAIVVSWFSWGSRKAFMKVAGKTLEMMREEGYGLLENYLRLGCYSEFKGNHKKIYRTFSYHDFYLMCGCTRILLKDLGYRFTGKSPQVIIDNWDEYYPHKNMFGSSDGVCKRRNMLFRWLARKDKIDLGVWADEVDKSKLLIPLDVHVNNTVNLLWPEMASMPINRNKVLTITEKLREFDQNDPIKYDFVLYALDLNEIEINREHFNFPKVLPVMVPGNTSVIFCEIDEKL